MRFAARVDANQSEIVDALRAAGRSVQSLSAMGKGVPDLLVGYRGTNYLLEVKILGGEMTPAQEEFEDNWCGQLEIVRTVDEALKATEGLDLDEIFAV
jgi:hypothetical protein